MTKTQYLAALRKLDLGKASQLTAYLLGLSVRHCQRIAAGDAEVPDTVAMLLAMYCRHGIPKEWC
jgi:hypothetical protein